MEAIAEDFGRGLAHWYELGDSSSPELVFSAANGHAVATYKFFLQRLASDFHIVAQDSRGAWPNQETVDTRFNWQDHAKDLEVFLDARSSAPVDYIGHSLGATVGLTLAVRRPELFRSLLLVEPASFPVGGLAALLLQRFPMVWMRHTKLYKGTAARQHRWPDRQSFARAMHRKGAYKGFSQEAIEDYASGGLIPEGEEFVLRYRRQWEAHNFCNVVFAWPLLRKLRVPCLFLRAEHTNMYSREFLDRQAPKLQSKNPLLEFRHMDGIGHMAIQEAPDQVAEVVRGWLAQRAAAG